MRFGRKRHRITDENLNTLRGRLGFVDAALAPAPGHGPHSGRARNRAERGVPRDSRPGPRRGANGGALVTVLDSADFPRAIVYAPDLDGQTDAGEVVWSWINTKGQSAPPEERAMIVVAHSSTHELLCLLISANKEHNSDSHWLSIGTGPWDAAGRPCWVRLDKLVETPELSVRRRGAMVPERRFERIAKEMRQRYSWL